MKTLSIRQPWANLIVHGIKDIENRSWRTNYRGRVLVHAPAKADRPDFSIQQAFRTDWDIRCKCSFLHTDPKEYTETILSGIPTNAIIGSVEITDCIRDSDSPWAETDCWNWVLRNPVLFDQPILGVKGKLGFWEFDLEEATL